MRVAQFPAQHDPGALVSLGREGKKPAGLEHPGGRAAYRLQIREIDEGVRRDDQVGARLLALERLVEIRDERRFESCRLQQWNAFGGSWGCPRPALVGIRKFSGGLRAGPHIVRSSPS